MSTIYPSQCKCSVCGEESEQLELMSTNSFGSPDLDLRPSQMQRGTMPFWIQKCPHCGYISGSIEDEAGIDKGFLASQEYRTCSDIGFQADLSKDFYRYYLINTARQKTNQAFYAILYAAWSCDDAGDTANAVHCRKLAIAEIEKMISQTDDETRKIQRADLLRRAGLFDVVINEYSDLHFEDEMLEKVVRFQIEKAKQKDTNCYTLSDVID